MTDIKKPPDKYKVLKIPLKNIIKDVALIPILFNATLRTHKLIIHISQFLRLWILSKYHTNNIIPEITKEVVQMAFKALTLKSSGPSPKGHNKELYESFLNFYDTEYKKLGYEEKLSGINLSRILDYTAVSMITAIENNIKGNFIKYIKRFVNVSFTKEYTDILEKYNGNEKKTKVKELRKELYTINKDLIDGTKLSIPKYHKWLDIHRSKILPDNIVKLSYQHFNSHPQQYLKCMIYMNIQIEALNGKLYQFFPLRTNIIPKYIPIDTKSLIELFVNTNLNDYLKNITEREDEIWNSYFKMNDPIFKMKNYTFNHYISTDCQAVSVHFIHNDFLEADRNKKELMVSGSKQYKEYTKEMTSDEKVIYQQKRKEENKIASKIIKNKMAEEFKKLSKDEQKVFKDKKKITHEEFPYLDELNNEQVSNLLGNSIYCDPGKRDIFTFIDDNDNVFRYSNRQRMQETKRLKYQKLQQNYKKKNKISQIESELSNFHSKSCSLQKSKEFIKKKNELNVKLIVAYCKPIFRQYKWYMYINTKRSEAKLLDKIERKFSMKNEENKPIKLNIIMGDWCIDKQMRHFISTPNIHLKRLLLERFNVYNLNEYNTSALHHKTEEKCSHLLFTDKTQQVSRKLHSVLTYTMENMRLGCINRDINAVKNMRKLVNYWFVHNDRPINYTQKVVNPSPIKTGVKLQPVRKECSK